MVWKKASLILSLSAAVVAGVGAVEYKIERYDVIVERSPFGEEVLSAPEVNNDSRNASAAIKAAEKELRLCFLLESESGEIRAGFENKTARPGDSKSVMLMVGESFRGMKLLEIDLHNSSATLDRNGAEVVFQLAKATAQKNAASKRKPSSSARRFGGGLRRSAPPPAPKEPQLSPEEQEREREAVRESLRQYQMEVLRTGMPPLPLPLTQEMDDQLVEEGVLPPAE